MADFKDAVSAHNVNLHGYTDDNQLYLHCCYEEAITAAYRLYVCITDEQQLSEEKKNAVLKLTAFQSTLSSPILYYRIVTR